LEPDIVESFQADDGKSGQRIKTHDQFFQPSADNKRPLLSKTARKSAVYAAASGA